MDQAGLQGVSLEKHLDFRFGFEEKYFALPKASPTETIMFLMDQNGLKQKDLIDVFGTPSIVSEVLRGKRELNKDHITRLSERFHVSPELFF